MTLIRRFFHMLLAEPIRDLRSMIDAGQPTSDIDMMVHAIERLRDTGEARPGGRTEGSIAGHEADAGAVSPDPFPGVSQARLVSGASPSSNLPRPNRQDGSPS